MWKVRGVVGEGMAPPPEALSFHGGTLLVVGCGRCVWDDLARYFQCRPDQVFSRMTGWARDGQYGTVMAVNEIIHHLECPVRHAASLHSDHLFMRSILRRSALRYLNEHPMLHTYRIIGETYGQNAVIWDFQNLGGMSGLFAAKVGVCLGYENIVLAGVPQDNTGRYYDPPDWGGIHASDAAIKQAWIDEMSKPDSELAIRVRSLSGNTREWLGEPKEMAVCAV